MFFTEWIKRLFSSPTPVFLTVEVDFILLTKNREFIPVSLTFRKDPETNIIEGKLPRKGWLPLNQITRNKKTIVKVKKAFKKVEADQ